MFCDRRMLLSFFVISVYIVADTAGNEAIVGGIIADVNEIPYHVILQVHGHGHDCGGGIIDNHHVITAAHCVIDERDEFYAEGISVLAGTNDLRKKERPTVTRKVKKVFVPMEYKYPPNEHTGDIAVLKLEGSLGLPRFWWHHANMKALNRPHKHDRFVHESAVISGFDWDYINLHAHDHEDGGNNDAKLRFANAKVLGTKECQRAYEIQRISEKHICARINQRDMNHPRGVCSGDSGGPLVHNHEIIIGILSVSPYRCDERYKAGIYTRVSEYLDFIHDAIHDAHHKDIKSKELPV